MESSTTHFQVLGIDLEAQVFGLGLENYKSSKMSCPRLEDSIIFYLVKKKKNKQKTTNLIVCEFVVSFPFLKNNTMW